MRKRKRSREIAVEVPKAMEDCAFAVEVGRGGGRYGVSDWCGCRGLVIRRVMVVVKNSADSDVGVKNETRDAYSRERLEAGKRVCVISFGRKERDRTTFT